MIDFESNWKIDRIEWAELPGIRPREAGRNARLGVHGQKVSARVAKVTIGGTAGFGWSRISREIAQEMVGASVSDLFEDDGKVKREYAKIEYSLLDWLGKMKGQPVYKLFGARRESAGFDSEPAVPCYDTTLYFDDIHLTDHAAASDLIRQEALEGLGRGHRNFKIKVGRGARWMPLQEGTDRDIHVIRAVREIAGRTGHIMIDANNGYNLNITKQVLSATADSSIYWVEEAFHEDRVLYEDLKEWMNREHLRVLIADGEGQASPSLMEWAEQGFVDVLQYDVMSPGFCSWLEMGSRFDAKGIKSAPHSYGNVLGNYVTGHLAAAIKGFQFVEWDQVEVEGIDASLYKIRDGFVRLPAEPGFGLRFDEAYFNKMKGLTGWEACV